MRHCTFLGGGGRAYLGTRPPNRSVSNIFSTNSCCVDVRSCPKRVRGIRVTDVAEIHARDPVARFSWSHYSCGTPPNGLMNDSRCWFLLFFEWVRVSAKIKRQRHAATDKLANIGNQRPLAGETPTRMESKSKTDQRQLCANWQRPGERALFVAKEFGRDQR